LVARNGIIPVAAGIFQIDAVILPIRETWNVFDSVPTVLVAMQV